MSQKLRGLLAQGMDARKANPDPGQPPFSYPTGSYTFTAPRAGTWKFVGWSAGTGGAAAGSGGSSGGYFEISRYLAPGQTAALLVGATTSVTFPDGRTASAAPSGVASGGDVNLNGSAGGPGTGSDGLPGAGSGGGAGGGSSGSRDGGAGAPGVLPFRGGAGASTTAVHGAAPGGGGSMPTTGVTAGGSGLLLVVFVRD